MAIARVEQNLEGTANLLAEMEKEGRTVYTCTHVESGEKQIYRMIQLGTNRFVVLCTYCSGVLVESILNEFKR